MYNKLNIDIGKIASKRAIKPELGCVAFYGDRTVATDSFRLIEMSADGEKQEKPTLYNYNLLKTLSIKKADSFEEARINHDGVHPIDATYPDIDNVFKSAEQEEYVEIKLNGEYLQEILSVLKQMNVFKAVTLKVPTTPYRAMIIEAGNDKQKARALLMPHNK